MTKIALVNHGCPKNLVDSELMLGILAEKGYEITLDENEAEIVIVNTCSFIHDAEKESVDSILEIADMGKKVIVTGCLPQKHKEDLKEAIPEIVGMLGTTDLSKIADVVEELVNKDFEYVSKVDNLDGVTGWKILKDGYVLLSASLYIRNNSGKRAGVYIYIRRGGNSIETISSY